VTDIEPQRATEENGRLTAPISLPEPACKYGYTRQQVADILNDEGDVFAYWMRGQTVALCDGREYDHDRREYVPGCPVPHGVVTYPHDLARFLAGGAIDD
jgi:hypothetical protein